MHARAGTTDGLVSTGPRSGGEIRTSSRCFTFFTNMLPSAANPFTANTARSVLSIDEGESGGKRRKRKKCDTYSLKTLGA